MDKVDIPEINNVRNRLEERFPEARFTFDVSGARKKTMYIHVYDIPEGAVVSHLIKNNYTNWTFHVVRGIE